MSRFLIIPPQRLEPDTYSALLQEYASRDGTDYGEKEVSLTDKVANLQQQISAGELRILYDTESDLWDLKTPEQAEQLADA